MLCDNLGGVAVCFTRAAALMWRQLVAWFCCSLLRFGTEGEEDAFEEVDAVVLPVGLQVFKDPLFKLL